ncbi:hypothetical protein [Pseudomonas helleri]
MSRSLERGEAEKRRQLSRSQVRMTNSIVGVDNYLNIDLLQSTA